MITDNTDRFDRPLSEILDNTDHDYYAKDPHRQRPKLTRKQAVAAEKEERETAFYIWCMISRYSDYCPFAYHD